MLFTPKNFSYLYFSANFLEYKRQFGKLPVSDTSGTKIDATGLTATGTPTYDLTLTTYTVCQVSKYEKYTSGGDTCTAMSDSVCKTALTTLKATSCITDNTALTCSDTHYMKNDFSACDTTCPSGTSRAPWSSISNAVCNLSCTSNTSCNGQVLTATQLPDIKGNITCTNSTARYGYNCFTDTAAQNTYLYFNRCYGFHNMIKEFPKSNYSSISKGYIIEFWFWPDPVNQFCANPVNGKKYIFLAVPHAFYIDATTTTTLVYEYLGNYTIAGTTSITNINQGEWNYIAMEVNISFNGTSQYLKVYHNYKLAEPAVKVLDIPTSEDLSLRAIAFCNSSNCTTYSPTINVNWGAAYYKNIRLWDNKLNLNVIQEFSNGYFTDTLKNLIYSLPMSIKYADNRVLKNLATSSDDFSFNSAGSLDNIDYGMIINYNGDFDYGLTNPNKSLASLSSTGAITTLDCNAACNKCWDNSINYCYKCNTGYKPVDRACVITNGFFLKTPPTTINTAYIEMDVGNKMESQRLTFTIWVKLYGISSHISSTCPTMFRLTTNEAKKICVNSSDLSLQVYDGTNV
ncbi:MAG: hypothetical protein GY861_10485, partial [bacterium]|nr:hypothetical protein [bacterium]